MLIQPYSQNAYYGIKKHKNFVPIPGTELMKSLESPE